MAAWAEEATRSFTLSVILFTWDVSGIVFYSPVGADYVGVMYSPSFLKNLDLPPHAIAQLHSVWAVLTRCTLQTSYVRVLCSAMLLLGSLTGDVVFRLPWIICELAALYCIAVLLICTWFLLFVELLVMNSSVTVLILANLFMLYCRIVMWQYVTWKTGIDAMIELAALSAAAHVIQVGRHFSDTILGLGRQPRVRVPRRSRSDTALVFINFDDWEFVQIGILIPIR